MSNIQFKKPVGLCFLAIFLMVSISFIPNNLSNAYVEFDVSGTDGSQDRSITSSQSSNQGSYCYAPPNATIINSCNSGDLSSSENTGMNFYEQ